VSSQPNKRDQLIIRPAILLVAIAVLAAILWRHPWVVDATATGRHSLMPQTLTTLQQFQTPIDAEAFVSPDDPAAQQLAQLLQRYQRANPHLHYAFTDPALDPARSRELDIQPGGELILSYEGRRQRLADVSQQSLTLALQRLLRHSTRKVGFISGHAERAIDGKTAADLTVFAKHLISTGYELETVQLSKPLDESLGMLVIAGPMQRYLPGEVATLLSYVSRGGNLLWLTEPGSDDGLTALEYELGISRTAGVVVDLDAQALQIDRPDFAIAAQYSTDEITPGFDSVTLFPQAVAIELPTLREWRPVPVVQTGSRAWNETGPVSGTVQHGDDEREISGPLTLVMALERTVSDGSVQRVVVAGDSDFLADAWIGNGGNRDLGGRLFNWVSDDHDLIPVSYPVPADREVTISKTAILATSALALIILPASLLAVATGVWYRRRHG
jgi:ABC-type uncharacterized transport system involved in gliding motility auxiliary subunit